MSEQELVRGTDGKVYRARQRTRDELDRVVGLVHRLRHVEHLSERAIIRALADRYGERRSAGAVHRDLSAYECDRCAGAQGGTG